MLDNVEILEKRVEEAIESCKNLIYKINSIAILNLNDGVNNPEYIKNDDLEWKKVEKRCEIVLSFCKIQNWFNVENVESEVNIIFSKQRVSLDDINKVLIQLDEVKVNIDNCRLLSIHKNVESNKTGGLKDNKEKFTKIFISHYSGDREIVECVVGFLEGLGFTEDNMFCSSISPYDIGLGEDSMDYIKNQFNNETLVVFLLTKNFFQRPVCMCEMGAAWAKAGKSIPIVEPNLDYEEIKGVIKDKQGFKINDIVKLNSFYTLLKNSFNIRELDINTWERKKNNFINSINEVINNRSKVSNYGYNILKADLDSYYTATITEKRSVPEKYRCYKINGIIDSINNPEIGETNWIFYSTNEFKDLRINDKVKFKVRKNELKDFPDIKNARNLYISELEIIDK